MDKITIPGVLLTPAKRIGVATGDVVTFCKVGEAGISNIAEVYGSLINQGARKGWRRHNKTTLNLVVPVGQIRFVLFDDRVGDSGQFYEVSLGMDNYQRLTVPAGVWMAFEGVAAGQSLLWNAIDYPHNPAEADTLDLSAIPYAW